MTQEEYETLRAQVLAESERERALVLRGECPGCGGALAIERDSRQVGAGPHALGEWHRTECSCGYRCDWRLPAQVQA